MTLKKPEKGSSLADVDPVLASEWNSTKNGGLTPYDVYPKASRKVWWYCHTCGYSWEATVNNRAHGSKCPACTGKTVWKGHNDLATVNPFLASEWHPTKNGDLTPQDVTKGANYNVWWICSKCGHEWCAQLQSRTSRGTGCPKCAGLSSSSERSKKIALARSTPKPGQSLADLHPELIPEWHPTKNGDLTPYDVKCASGLKVWWKCSKCGYEWETRIAHRSRDHGCPECRKEKLSEVLNYPKLGDYLADANPILASEWHPTNNGSLTPSDVASSSNNKVWWKCSKCGHEWRATVNNRSRGAGCPRCESMYQTSFGEKAAYYYVCKLIGEENVVSNYKPSGWGGLELDIYIPSSKIAIEFDGWSHALQIMNERDNRKNAICIEHGVDLVRIRYPKLPEITNCTCYQLSSDSNKDVGLAISKVLDYVCSRMKVEAKYDVDLDRDRTTILVLQREGLRVNSLAEVYPDIASEWHPTKNGNLIPGNFNYGSAHKVWWLCPTCGYEWEAIIGNRTVSKTGCPYCTGKAVWKGHNDLATLNPSLASEWHPTKNMGLSPQDVGINSHKKVTWLCSKCGHEWSTEVVTRSEGGGSCPICAKNKGRTRGVSFAEACPGLVFEWHPTKNGNLSPHDVKSSSKHKVWWHCSNCGYEWVASVGNRSRGSGCPVCTGKAVWKGHNDLATLNPSLASEWHPTKNGNFNPCDVRPYCNKKAWWLCPTCGYEWEAVIGSRSKGHGCPRCHK